MDRALVNRELEAGRRERSERERVRRLKEGRGEDGVVPVMAPAMEKLKHKVV